MRKDFYVVLGVQRDASPHRIRRSFRELALRYHPDRAGPQTTRYFQDALEAYRVLSDPTRRAAHDAELRRHEQHAVPAAPASTQRSRMTAEPLGASRPAARRPAAEPLVPDPRPRPGFALEVLLTPTEAVRGVALELRPHLPGRLFLPPGLRDGDRFQVTIDAHGRRPVVLRIHVRLTW